MDNYDVLKKANSGGAVLLGKSQLYYEDRWLFSKVAVSLIFALCAIPVGMLMFHCVLYIYS